MMKRLACEICSSPIGEIQIVLDQETLVLVDFRDNAKRIGRLLGRRFGNHTMNPSPRKGLACRRLKGYFDGDWAAFDDLAWDTGGTTFQCSVWRVLCTIPRGEVISYHELAERVGNPRAIRAVASANANNPISIMIPCHRVIGKDGALRGYAGGLDRKAWLLNHEGARQGQF